MINQDQIVLAELAALLVKGNTLSQEQEEQLDILFDKYPHARTILSEMLENQTILLDFNPMDTNVEQEWEKFKPLMPTVPTAPNHTIGSKLILSWKKYLKIAAAIIAVLSFGYYLWTINSQPDYIISNNRFGQKNDVLPGKNFAQLEIVGKKETKNTQSPLYRLHIPKRARYAVTLDDGTKVWLNPESQLEYVKGFTLNERRVRLVGEGYFEVAKDARRPFIVETKQMEIKAIGTAFSVSSYNAVSKVLLTEGKIKVSAGKEEMEVLAGNQVLLSDQGLKLQKLTNTEDTKAMKEGYFNFSDKNIQEILQEMERWYGVELIIKRPLDNKVFEGNIDKNVTLGEICELLKKLTNYDYIIDGDKLIIQ